MTLIRVTCVALLILAAGIVSPRFLIRDTSRLNADQIACATRDARLMLDNPIEQMLTLKLVVARNDQSESYTVTAHSLFGLPYARVLLRCGGDAAVQWRLFGILK